MFVFYHGNQPRADLIISYLKNHIAKDEVISLHSVKEFEQISEKNENFSFVFLFFVNNIDKTRDEMKILHSILQEHHNLGYFIGAVPANLMAEEKFFSDSFEAFFSVEEAPEIFLKEVKKGKNFIQSLSEQIDNQEAFLHQLEPTISEHDANETPEFLFDESIEHIQSDLDKIKKSPNTPFRELYLKLQKNFVWPGKVVVKNIRGAGLVYKEEFFEVDIEKNSLFAKKMGFVQERYFQLDFVPAVEISEDEMESSCFILALPGEESSDSLNHFIEGFHSYGVNKGINYEAFAKTIKKLQEQESIMYSCVAKGKNPEHGYAAYTQILKEQPKSIGKIIDEQGTIDYREHSNIININSGEIIAKTFPEKPSINGYTVTGTVLKGEFEKKESLTMGENIAFSEQSGEYTAQVDGMLVFEGGKTVHLKETLIIPGDVNMKTGHIHSKNNVIIQGNIDPDMHVEAKGNIIVKGVAEDARVVAGGEIEAHGFTGSGKTWVFSRGNIKVDFCQNTHIEALGDVSYNKFIINSTIFTTKKLLGQDKSRLIGGEVHAAQGCNLFTLGNEQETPCKIVLGVNFYNDKIVSRLLDRLSILKHREKEDMDFLREYLNLRKPIDAQLKTKSVKEAKRLIEKINSVKKTHLQIQKLEKSFQSITGELKNEFGARLKIRNKSFPGNEVVIAGVHKKIQKITPGVQFFFSPAQADILEENIL